MSERTRFPQEISAASGLLRAWGILRDGEFLREFLVEDTIRRYAKDHLYNFGSNLFEHLSVAATLPNKWSFPGPTSDAGAVSELEKFLYETTVPSKRLDAMAIRAKFSEIADRVRLKYKVKLKYRSELMPLKNIEEAEKAEAALWVKDGTKKGV